MLAEPADVQVRVPRIGMSLSGSPCLLRLTLAVVCVLVGLDVAAVVGRQGEVRMTLALIGTIFYAFLTAHLNDGGAGVGFRLTPAQGWVYWLKAAVGFGAVLAAVLAVAGAVFFSLGYTPPKPLLSSQAEMWSLFVWMCITAPIFEEVTYRLVLCPPLAALIGDWPCIVVSGLIFAGLHVLYGTPSPENLLGGFFLTWSFLKSGTLLMPLALHSLGNLFAFTAQVAYFYWLQ